MKKRNGFTLIELLAVIVILAIIALIATPMVLKYIKTSKEGSYDNSIDNILRAADNYYAGSLLNTKTTYPLTFAFPNNKELGVKGKQPDSGSLTIYEDGSTYLYAVYDEIIYTKLPNEQRARRYNMVVGDDITWTTDGKGTLIEYKESTSNEKINNQLDNFATYLSACIEYAQMNKDNDSLSLKEEIEKLEQNSVIDRRSLPLELNKEIDIILELYNIDNAITEEEAIKMIDNNRDKLPYYADYYDWGINNNDDITKLKVYQLINDNIKNANVLIIPNYIKHADGTKEKIIKIGNNIFYERLMPISDAAKGMDIIISNGIEEIGDTAFPDNGLNSVNIANTVKVIGSSAFRDNKFTSLILPANIEIIKFGAFRNNLIENITIPSNIKLIESEAFLCSTLKSATIERAKGSDLRVDSTAFGNITPVYQNS
ncbi:MAG: leucine-rich repeat domain-containing protein [Bacilli bacterium]